MMVVASEQLVELLKTDVERFNTHRQQIPDPPRVDHFAAYRFGAEAFEAALVRAALFEVNLFGTNLFEADLSGANLSGADLSKTDLVRADLSGANLSDADLYRADLSDADLYRADLSGANLSGANLSGANLSEADLVRVDLSETKLLGVDLSGAKLLGVDLSGVDLSGVDLSGVNLARADLVRANLTGADLVRANLTGANLTGANLSGADLVRANLTGANLTGANLSGAKLSSAVCGGTVWGGADLSEVVGLDAIRHLGPSSVGVDTLYLTGTGMPTKFLTGCGLPSLFINYLDALVTPWAFEYRSCFLSYNTEDSEFADRLFKDIRGRDVRIWQDKRELLPGDNLDRSIMSAIRKAERMLLVCSKTSLSPQGQAWVNREVGEALAKEREHLKQTGEHLTFLIPIDIDGFLFTEECTYERRQDLRDRVAGRFVDDDAYEESVEKLLKALHNHRPPGILNIP